MHVQHGGLDETEGIGSGISLKFLILEVEAVTLIVCSASHHEKFPLLQLTVWII
jgi:hypothetical protein